MPLRDIQRRNMEIGRIRLGVKVQMKNGKSRPSKLQTFRLTSANQYAITVAARLFGGEARPWVDSPSPGQWEVTTEASSLPCQVPAGEAALSQWYELWAQVNRKGVTCVRRCDGVTEQISDEPCLCPKDPVERANLGKDGKACRTITRVSVIIPDLPGLGVWRVQSSGWNAANELGGVAELLAVVRERGVIVPAMLRLDQRSTVLPDGSTSRYVVPVLDPIPTTRQLSQMKPGDFAASLPPAPEGALAIEATPDQAKAVGAPPAWAAEQAEDAAGQPPAPEGAVPPTPDGEAASDAPTDDDDGRYGCPDDVADAARDATAVAVVRTLYRIAFRREWLDEYVEPTDETQPLDLLRDVLTDRARALEPAPTEPVAG